MGTPVGAILGWVGKTDGLFVGSVVGKDGILVGIVVGSIDGIKVGYLVGTLSQINGNFFLHDKSFHFDAMCHDLLGEIIIDAQSCCPISYFKLSIQFV